MIKLAVVVLILVILGLAILLLKQKPAESKFVPPRHECYIWQRAWTDELQMSILKAAEHIHTFIGLAAEVDVRPGRQQRQMIPVDHSFLSRLQEPAGLAIRINPYSGPFGPDADATKYLIQTIQDVLASAKELDFTPSEVQIDYDCAESKLAGYCAWVKQLKQAFPEYPITITALPSWMKQREFKRLIQSSDGYVLQVHSLEKPQTFDQKVVLCDPKRVLAWVQQAERLGVPYRVALPTYGYLVAYDEQGQFFGLSAEGLMPGWPRKTRVKTILSNPKEIAAILQEIQTLSPKHLSGIIWFRLPVPSDQLNWQWHTLECVIQGQTLTEKIEAVCDWSEPNLAEIYLVNSGDVDVSGWISVSLAFEGSCLAADGLLGYAVIEDKKGGLLVRPDTLDAGWRIRSQEKIKIAWCRFDREMEVNADVQVQE
jgi:hypothetical protein